MSRKQRFFLIHRWQNPNSAIGREKFTAFVPQVGLSHAVCVI
uniref:Uncharacterized protein n=1 Tax=Rhizophora mucronata TaxID=61149 RepID=A0A2P2NR02_RHIMU